MCSRHSREGGAVATAVTVFKEKLDLSLPAISMFADYSPGIPTVVLHAQRHAAATEVASKKPDKSASALAGTRQRDSHGELKLSAC